MGTDKIAEARPLEERASLPKMPPAPPMISARAPGDRVVHALLSLQHYLSGLQGPEGLETRLALSRPEGRI